MWPKAYRDYKEDETLVKNQVSPSHGIIGCEMHDLNGWGTTHHVDVQEKKHGVFATFLISFFSKFSSKNDTKRK